MEIGFEKTAIIFNPDIKETSEIANILHSKIKNSKNFSIKELEKDIDFAIVIGGDGSLLKCARFYSKFKIPILGFNFGRLGYLTQAKPEDCDNVIEKIKNKDFKIENRLMLKSNNNTALNDIVIKSENCARSFTFDLLINDKTVCSYVADGVIISTPTGSTAYSLSAGGPIISPEIDCLLIIPICPHTLNTRPIIVPANEKIKIKTKEEGLLNVSFDGQVDLTLNNEIEIEKNEDFAKLLILNNQKNKFYDILKEKLHWSLSPKK